MCDEEQPKYAPNWPNISYITAGLMLLEYPYVNTTQN